MNEQRQNEVCCEIVGLREPMVRESRIYYLHHGSLGGLVYRPLFTRDDNMARLLRAAVIEAGAWQRFLWHLKDIVADTDEHGLGYGMGLDMRLMQATPAQQVGAALRALGKWEES